MSDTPNQIKNKINKHAFSGGQETLELHRELGGNPDVDVPYQYLAYFEDDDEKLKWETLLEGMSMRPDVSFFFCSKPLSS